MKLKFKLIRGGGRLDCYVRVGKFFKFICKFYVCVNVLKFWRNFKIFIVIKFFSNWEVDSVESGVKRRFFIIFSFVIYFKLFFIF